MNELDEMTADELADRWEARDMRYREQGRMLTPTEVEAVRMWRLDEAETVGGAKGMTDVARDWRQPW